MLQALARPLWACVASCVAVGQTSNPNKQWRAVHASTPVSPIVPHAQVALNSAGISADGVGHLSPLTISVRQQNLETTRLLLRHGAPPLARVAGLPLLLHFHEAVMATASFGRPSGQLAPLSRAASLTVSGGDGGVTSGMGAGSQGDGICGNGSDMTSMMQVGAGKALQGACSANPAPPGWAYKLPPTPHPRSWTSACSCCWSCCREAPTRCKRQTMGRPASCRVGRRCRAAQPGGCPTCTSPYGGCAASSVAV